MGSWRGRNGLTKSQFERSSDAGRISGGSWDRFLWLAQRWERRSVTTVAVPQESTSSMIFRRQPLTPEHYRYVRRLSETLARGDGHFADEIEQDTLAAAISADRTEVRSTQAWLTGIARYVSYGRRRRASTGPRFVELKGPVESGARLADPAEAATEAELSAGLAGLLKTLPPAFAEVITLRIYEDLPPREIAARLDLPVETVRSRLRRGLALLKVAVERDLSDHLDHKVRAGIGFSVFGRWEWAISGMVLASLAVVAAILWGHQEPKHDQSAHLVDLVALEAQGLGAFAPAVETTREPISMASKSPSAPGFDLRLSRKPRSGQPLLESVQLVGPEGVVQEITFQGLESELLLSALAPGVWSAKIGATVLDTREFAHGEHSWELELPQPQVLSVHVADENEHPVAGARIFSQEAAFGLAREVATTDADGNARIAMVGPSQWLAASYRGNMRSESIQVDQRSFQAEVELILLSYQAFPHRFVLPDGVESRVHQVRAVTPNWKRRFRAAPKMGLSGPAYWVPLEQDSEGRHLTLGHDPMIVEFLDESGDVVALASHEPSQDPEVVKVGSREPIGVSGRLLGHDSQPIQGADLSLIPARFFGRVFGRARTDEFGRFRFEGVPPSNWKIVEDGTTLKSIDEVSFGEELQGTLTLDDLVVHRESLAGTVVGDFTGKRLSALRGAYPYLTASSILAGVSVELSPVDVADNGTFRLEGARTKGIRALVITEPDKGDAPVALIRCPEDGWTLDSLTIMADESHAVAVECSIARSLLPARVAVLDADGPFAQRVDVDNTTGVLTGLQLCAGDWKLVVLAADGALHRFDIHCPAGPQGTLALGCLEEELGTVRVLSPDEPELIGGNDVVILQVARHSSATQEERIPLSTLLDGRASLQLPAGPVKIEMPRGRKSFYANAVVRAGQSVDVKLERRQPTARISLRSVVDPMDTLDLKFVDADGQTIEELQIKHAVATHGRRFETAIPAMSSGTIEVTSTSGRINWSIPVRAYRDVQAVSAFRNNRPRPSISAQ